MFGTLAVADETNKIPQRLTESQDQYAARMKWFGDARFGMFIHWGVYSVPAGEWNGQIGYGEWIMENAKIPVSRYEKFADEFNPVKFNARDWVRIAKDAGMKYIVITSKHHDGFCLWDSKLTDWDIARTPFKHDPLKELSEACRAEGITFCLYHSIMDWHHPDYENRRAWNDTATGTPDMNRYMTYFKGQLREIITSYGPLGYIWFDGEWEGAWNTERGIETYNFVRELQPSLIANNRVGRARDGMMGFNKGAGVGDYATPEQEIPPTSFGPGVFWETCMTINDHWGYNKRDQNWKSTRTLIHNLVDIASKGGNYLLNVGPTAEGLIPEGSAERLREMGAWLNSNGAAIYGTDAGPFRKLPWGRCTQKTNGKETTLYLHVFNWPGDGKLFIPGLLNEPIAATLLVGGGKLSAKRSADGVVIELPREAPDKFSSTVVLRVKGKIEVADNRIQPSADGSLHLEAVDADITGRQLRAESLDGKTDLGYWSDAADYASWPVNIARGGEYKITADTAGEGDAHFIIEIGGEKLTVSSPGTKSYHAFITRSVGTMSLKQGNASVVVRPVTENWQPMNLRFLRLTPVVEKSKDNPGQ